jgi:hypothetical protein
MKKIIFSISLLIFPAMIYSQVTQLIFDYNKIENLKSKELTRKINPVKNGNFINIKIENINTFLYKVEIEGKQVELLTPIPSELQTLFRVSDEVSDETKAKEGIGDLEESLNIMNDIDKNSKNAKVILPPNLIKACKRYIEISKKVAKIKYQRMKLIQLSKEDLDYSEMQGELGEVGALPNSKVYEEFVTIYGEVEALYEIAKHNAKEKLENIKTELKKEQKKTTTNQNPNEISRLTKDSTQSHQEYLAIEKALEGIEEGHEKIDDDNFLRLIEDVITLFGGLENKKNFEVVSPPVQMEGDMVSYRITITPTRVNSLASYKSPMSFTVNIPAKGGWKTDFSVGPAISFGDNAKDDNYFLKTEPSSPPPTQGTLIKRDNENFINPSIGAFMHVYQRTGRPYAVGGLFGVGAGFQTIDDLNLSIYGGGTLILGKTRKVMVGVGVSILKVDRLKSPEYEVGGIYDLDTFDINNVTEKVFKPSGFLSITFNLANRLEIN